MTYIMTARWANSAHTLVEIATIAESLVIEATQSNPVYAALVSIGMPIDAYEEPVLVEVPDTPNPYTVLWARYGDENQLTVQAMTVEAAMCGGSASVGDRIYDAVVAQNVVIGPYEPPAPVVPASVTRTQGLLALLDVGITEAVITSQIAAIPDATERERSRIRFNSPTWERNSDLLVMMAAAFGLSPAQVDDLFIAAALL